MQQRRRGTRAGEPHGLGTPEEDGHREVGRQPHGVGSRILVELDRNRKILSRDILAVDLRLPDRVTVRQSDAAAAARDQALKDAEKIKKSKAGKGGEA